jgi:lipopolysaccharide transport system permease protein
MSTAPAPLRPQARAVAVIKPTAGAIAPRVREAWHNPELLWFLTLRDVKVRYAQTVLGWLWAVLQPVGLMLVFLFAFRTLGNVKTDGVPYPLFAFSGLAFWTFFSRAVLAGADSLVLNQPLVTKTAAPRLLMPLAAVTAALVDLAITMTLLLILVLAYGEPLRWQLVFLPAVVLLGILLAAGLGVLLAGINVRWRDVRNGMPFAIQLVLFMCPVAYSLQTLGVTARTIVGFNPLVGIVEAFRWCWVGTPAPTATSLAISVGATVVICLLGLRSFSRVAREFADVA